MPVRRTMIVVAGAAVIAAAVATRVTAGRSATALATDVQLMNMSRVGPPALYRSTFEVAEAARAVLEVDVDGERRSVGVATLLGREILLLPADRSIEGVRADDPPPVRFADALGTRRTDEYKTYLQAIGYRAFTTSVEVLRSAPPGDQYIRYGERALPSRILDADLDTGVVVLVVQFDDRSEEEDDEDDESPPTPRWADLEVGSDAFVVLGGARAERPRTRGFEMVRAGENDDGGGPVARTSDIVAADVGGPVVAGFDDGTDGLVGMIGQPSDDGFAPIVPTRVLYRVARRAAEADADVTPTTPALGVSGHSVIFDRLWGEAAGPQRGVVVDRLVDGSAAEAAGLREGDLVTQLDDVELTSWTDLLLAVRHHQVGDEVVLTVVRPDGGTLRPSVRLGAPAP